MYDVLNEGVFIYSLKGVVSLDIDISNLEINQCEADVEDDCSNQIYSFHGTHKCPNETTYVSIGFVSLSFIVGYRLDN